MSLPRFSSGSFGRLSFEHMNLICDTVERVRPLLVNNALQGGAGSFDILFARITARDATNGSHQWVEVEPLNRAQIASPVRWKDRTDGRKSYAPTDGDKYQPAYAIPAWNSTATTLIDLNAICVLSRTKSADGKVAWLSIASVAAMLPFAAKITSSQPVGAGLPGAGKRWAYAFSEVIWTQNNQTGGEWTTLSGGRTSGTVPGGGPAHSALNGCEQNNQTPFGGSGPGAVEPLPIPTGTVVSMGYASDGTPFFSIPNPLAVDCSP